MNTLPELTDKQRRFCHEYITDHCPTAAALRAGYSNSGYGSNLLMKKHVKEFVNSLEKKITDRIDITSERVLEELAIIAFSDIVELVSWETKKELLQDEKGNSTFPMDITGEDGKEEGSEFQYVGGVRIKTPKELTRRQTAAISEISDTKYGLRLKLHNKMDALKALAQYRGLMGPKGTEEDPVHHSLDVNWNDPEARKAILDEYFTRQAARRGAGKAVSDSGAVGNVDPKPEGVVD